MNRSGQTLDINRAMLWAVPLLAIAFLYFQQSATGPFNVKEVTVAEARALIDGGALVIDVRGEEAFQGRHLPGALSVPLSQLRQGVPASLADAKDKSIVVYCGDGVTTGPQGTQILNDAGYTRAVNIKSGIQGWHSAGLSVQP